MSGEVGSYGTDEGKPVLLICSDGTLLEIWYGEEGIFKMRLIKRGTLFDNITPCTEETEDVHSDKATFEPGLKWIYAATEWEKVK